MPSLVPVPLQAVLDITGGAVSDPMLFQSVMIEQLADQSRVLKVHAHVSAVAQGTASTAVGKSPTCLHLPNRLDCLSVLVIARCYTAVSASQVHLSSL